MWWQEIASVCVCVYVCVWSVLHLHGMWRHRKGISGCEHYKILPNKRIYCPQDHVCVCVCAVWARTTPWQINQMWSWSHPLPIPFYSFQTCTHRQVSTNNNQFPTVTRRQRWIQSHEIHQKHSTGPYECVAPRSGMERNNIRDVGCGGGIGE